jgi:hypothetical protein
LGYRHGTKEEVCSCAQRGATVWFVFRSHTSLHQPVLLAMSSFYRSSAPRRAPDHDVRTMTQPQLHPVPSRQVAVAVNEESKWAPVRKAKPANVLLPGTRRWLEMLSMDVQPQALATKFPRLANRIAADWSIPDACRTFIYDLLVDRRGGRMGFPQDVLQDILALRALYSHLHPQNEGIGIPHGR